MNLRLSSSDFEITAELEKYAYRKLGEITKQIPRRLRATCDCQMYFTQKRLKSAKQSTCTVSLRLEELDIKAEETTTHMYAALDIAAVQVTQQLRDYKRRRTAELRRVRRLRGRDLDK